MKKNATRTKKLMLSFFAMLVPLVASAEKVEIDGIWYNLVSKAKQAEVTYKGDSYDSYSNEYSGSITIPATVTYNGVDYSVTSIGDYTFYYCSSLTAITLPEGVTSIGEHAFSNCSSLITITIPEGVTSIGKSAFSGCSSLTTITIPEGVTSIGNYAFDGCSSLTAVHISDIAAWCNIKFSDYFSNPLYYAHNLYLNGELVKQLTIPDGVTSIGGYAFEGCSSLTAITIPSSVTSIGWNAFYYCSSLTTITLPESVTSIGEGAFSGCESLTAINIPEGVTSIGMFAFDGCSSLTAVHISSIEAWCKISFVDSHSNPLCSAHNLYLNGELVTELVIPEGVTSIGNYAFQGCSSLTAITIPESVTSIGDFAFDGCSSLTSITIPEGVTSIGYRAFRYCSSLTSIIIPEGVTSIEGSAFEYCSSLTAIILPEGVTSIGNYAFRDCSSLTTITLPEGVWSIGSNAFANCPELLDVYCYAKSVPQAEADAFDGSYPEYATLHVPTSALNAYKTTAPWNSFGKFETFEITVENITLNQSTATLTEGETLVLTAMVTPNDATDKSISWSSSNPSVATVDNTGKVTAVAPGAAIITAMANDGSGVSASCEVTVLPAEYILTAYIDGEVFVTDTLARGTIITPPDYPTKEGYTFSGWGEVPETMPAHDVTINATFIPNKYLVTFKIGDEVIASDSLEYQSAIVAPEAPEKEGYAFNGWGDVAGTVPASDLTYEGSYSVNSYLLTYAVDGETVQSDTVIYGTAIDVIAEPTKEGYTFSGWIGVPETMPASDVTINGAFTINKYLVTFKIGDEVVVADSLEYGAAIVAPEAPEKEGYTFSGWGEVPTNVPASDVTINGAFTINKYLVTFKIGDEVIASDSLEYGAAIVAPGAPEKEGYTFNGWGDVAETVPANDLTYEGSYTINSYLLAYTVDGEIVQSDSVMYGAEINVIAEPTKEGYTFSGWIGVPETMPAYDVTINGAFTINKYLVTFKIGDEVIASDSLEYGAAIVAPGAPEKEGYTFDGWGDVAETVPASDLTYEGSYTVNSYLLTYTVDGEVVQADSVVYGSAVTALDEPNKEGYTFSGWSDIPATMPASDVTINGAFIINKYLVTFKIGDEVIASDSLEYGAAIVAPDAPEKEGYTFNGWGDVAETVPAGDVAYEGSYTVNVYNVYYYVGEELVHTAEVAYGEAIPEYVYEPAEEGCTFLGWVGESYEAMPAHDVTYTANIDNGIEQFIIDNSQLMIYDLTGRRVINTENLKGGIYIVNGRKVIVK